MEQIKDKEIEALELEVKNKLCEFSEIIKQEYDKREEIKDHRKKLCKLYGKIYEKYTGKKVKVVSTNSIGTCELVGFFKGFSFYSYFDATYTVIPSIVLKKVKKDGTESVYEYPLYKVPSVKDIESIEIIE